MIPVIQKILYATDLSENSAHAFRYAVVLAEDHNAEIVILHVMEGISPASLNALDIYLSKDKLLKIVETDIEEAVSRIKERLTSFYEREFKREDQALGKDVSIEVYGGYPAEEILKKADEFGCDVIVMGTHGKGVLSHTFLGSVTEKVLHRAKIPVFVVPLPKGNTVLTFHD